MISADYVRTMAAYNKWQNRSVYTAADGLNDAERKEERGAFFGSIHATLNHLLWADQIWMSRFAGTPGPKAGSIPDSVNQIDDWQDLKRQRVAFDDIIVGWAQDLDPMWLKSSLTWFSKATGREMTAANALLAAHLFNHQTHHRGQVHAMLTAAGAKPDDTDLMLLSLDEVRS